MKRKLLIVMMLTISVLLPYSINAQSNVVSTDVQTINNQFFGSALVLGQVSITTTEPGTVLVEFDGNCISDPGDRILLAASNTMNWSVNDGHVAVEAYDTDINSHSFSHTRAYTVGAGTHTFYAVGQNFVETAGSGIASVFGNLVAKFFPDSGPAKVLHTGVVQVNRDLNNGVENIASLTFNAPQDGSVIVKFNGMCVSDPDDLIIIAASDNIGWLVNDGNTGTEAIDNDLNTRVFSHTRKYNVTAGNNTFYGVAENYVETGGNGIASFYGSLTVIYLPSNTNMSLSHVGVNKTNIDVRGNTVTMGEITIEPTVSGKAVVTYDGLCASSPGDRIVMAASDTEDWSANTGNVSAEAISTDLNYNNFSHTRVYDIAAGSHTFYAVCENYVETGGTGIASNYGSLTVQFFTDEASIINSLDNLINLSANIKISPNPTSDYLNIQLNDFPNEKYIIEIFDTSGKIVKRNVSSYARQYEFDLSNFNKGNYFIRIKGETAGGVQQISVH